MTWSWNPELTTNRDIVRFLLGDTNRDAPKLENETIDWALTQETNLYFAGALLAESISASHASSVSRSVGGLSVSGGERQSSYATLAERLRVLAFKTAVPIPISTGQSIGEKAARRSDGDLNLTRLRDDLWTNLTP